MSRTYEVTVFQFDELSDDAKAKALDWYRAASACDSFWSEYQTEKGGDFATIAKFCGWTIDPPRYKQTGLAIYWSGFGSQGDGLCFEGSWTLGDVNAAGMKEHAPQDVELARLVDRFEEIAVQVAADPDADQTATCRGDGRYHNVSFETGDAFSAEIESEFAQASRDLMHWMYRALEREYEYQNSDEIVADNIRVNEYEFNADGSRT